MQHVSIARWAHCQGKQRAEERHNGVIRLADTGYLRLIPLFVGAFVINWFLQKAKAKYASFRNLD